MVERLPARLRRVEGDAELLLRSLLPDEVVEPARAQRALDLLVLGSKHGRQKLRAHAALRERDAHALLRRQVGIDRRQRLLRVHERPAELDERLAGDHVRRPVRPGSAHDVERPELLLQLEHDPLGGLLPDAGDHLEARVVPERDRAAQLAGGEPETTASATFGPIPLTVSSSVNSSRSSASANPYSCSVSSRTCRYVSIVVSPRLRPPGAPPASRRRDSRRR